MERLEIPNMRGKHPNSIKALETARIKSLETRRENARVKALEKEVNKYKKSAQTLHLELEIKRMQERKKENRRLEKQMRQEMEADYTPLNRIQLKSVIKNIFDK